MLDPARLVFIDETAVSTNLARVRGRAPSGDRVIGTVPLGAWETITFVAALRHNKMTAPMMVIRPTARSVRMCQLFQACRLCFNIIGIRFRSQVCSSGTMMQLASVWRSADPRLSVGRSGTACLAQVMVDGREVLRNDVRLTGPSSRMRTPRHRDVNGNRRAARKFNESATEGIGRGLSARQRLLSSKR